MGKRRERRLAALSNAGRRVKLDLFVEPSGDLDGSEEHEEVGGNIDSRQTTKLPESAASSGTSLRCCQETWFWIVFDVEMFLFSGHQAQNPLLLLEQYSDDEEVDQDLNKNSDQDEQDALLPDHNDEVPAEECEKMDASISEDLTAQKAVPEESERGSVEFSENLESKDEAKAETNNLGYLSKETDLVQTSVPATTSVHVPGDVISGWRIVMHEESHNYYYWNVETGETSWEVPDVVLAQAQPTQSTTDIKTSPTQFPENVKVFKQESCLTNGGKLDVFSSESVGYKNGVPVCASQGSEVDQSNAAFSTCSNDVNITKAGSEIYADYMMTNEELKSGLDLPSQLVNWSASLLERLKSLQKSGGHEWTLKYILETQIRLSDLKSLMPYKTSLLPFWEHSTRQLKQIEDGINKEIYQSAAGSSQLDEAKAVNSPNIEREEKFQERSNVESEVEKVANSSSGWDHSHLPTDSASLTLQGDQSQVTVKENVPLPKAIEHSGNSTGVIEHVSEDTNHEMASKSDEHSVEDVDMEVDMEVEDASSAGNLMVAGTSDMSVAKSFISMEQPVQLDPQAHPFLSSGYASMAPEDGSVAPPPPPPDEEWIPPPPPDNEDVPPPPPDEPVEPLYHPMPPSYTQLGQPLCYTEPYQVAYPDSSIKYYAHPVPEVVPSANFYGHPGACTVVMAQAPFYYEAVPNSHTDSAPVVVNGVVPEGYGILQDATTSLPVYSTADSSQLHVASSSLRFDPSSSIQYGSSDMAITNTATATEEIDKGRGETTTASFQASTSGSPSIDVPPTISAVTNSSTVANTSAVPKVQPKVLRSKKRTVAPSLRSNKKVSSLLDKWKAAKEELEDEEEPENAYEILEKKREREIKEWHAQQIASGDAKENANFQPLGGDWRERVKRRRAQSSTKEVKEVTHSPAAAEASSTDGNQQPDLAKISKDLPSGWQAYWDESSKQVYYGNVNTSETSWTKPSK